MVAAVSCSHVLVPIFMPPFWLLYPLLPTFQLLPLATSVSFNFDFKQPGGYNAANFSFEGDAYFDLDSKVVELTKNGSHNSIGRASYEAPVPIWDEVTGELASFTTTFSFQIVADSSTSNGRSGGDGMAFFFGHYPSTTPNNSVGGSLGLVRSRTTNATGDHRVVAVEFDTFVNEGTDAIGNHMGIDLNSVASKAYVNTSVPGLDLTSGLVMTCWISYVNSTQRIAADLRISNESYQVDMNVDLRQLLPSKVSIGFSAATGAETELHRILSWSFNSTLDGFTAAPSPSPVDAPSPSPANTLSSSPADVPSPSPANAPSSSHAHAPSASPANTLSHSTADATSPSPAHTSSPSTADASSSSPAGAAVPHHGKNFSSKRSWKVVGPVIGVVVISIAALAGLACLSQRCPGTNPAAAVDKQPSSEEAPANIPRPFSYHELAKATNNFAPETKLGEGGYAVVYKGQVTNPNRWVAIKKFKLGPSEQASQRRKAFEDEIKVISQVRQRHLVELVGWCIDVKEDILSLVYELLSEGTLYEHLHKGRSWLQWPTRYQIILELGCALQYLHKMCRDCVLHGDISTSNILLDSRYVAKLADFGLARLMDHGRELEATCNLAGTPGYVDPDFMKIGKRSRESDVYSFGIVLLETVSGRKPAPAPDCATEVSPLLKWVWGLHQKSIILEAADPKLKHESFREDHAQMERVLLVGLWCAHTDPRQRPPIQDAMRALTTRDVVIPQLSLPKFMAGPSGLAADHLSYNSIGRVLSSATAG